LKTHLHIQERFRLKWASFCYFQEKLANGDAKLSMRIRLNEDLSSLYKPDIYWSDDGTRNWVKVPVDDHAKGYVAFSTDSGGHFVVSKSVAPGPMAGKCFKFTSGLVVMS